MISGGETRSSRLRHPGVGKRASEAVGECFNLQGAKFYKRLGTTNWILGDILSFNNLITVHFWYLHVPRGNTTGLGDRTNRPQPIQKRWSPERC